MDKDVLPAGLVEDRILRFEKSDQRKQCYQESDVYGIVKKAGGHSLSKNPGV